MASSLCLTKIANTQKLHQMNIEQLSYTAIREYKIEIFGKRLTSCDALSVQRQFIKLICCMMFCQIGKMLEVSKIVSLKLKMQRCDVQPVSIADDHGNFMLILTHLKLLTVMSDKRMKTTMRSGLRT